MCCYPINKQGHFGQLMIMIVEGGPRLDAVDPTYGEGQLKK